MKAIAVLILLIIIGPVYGQFVNRQLVCTDPAAYRDSWARRELDLDNDGLIDLICYGDYLTWRKNYGAYFGNPIEICNTQGIGSWSCGSTYFLEGKDLDHNGHTDIVFDGGYVLNYGTGAFSQPVLTNLPNSRIIDVSDIDGDLDLDFFIAQINSSNQHISKILKNQGNGTFIQCTSCVIPIGDVVELADVNNDTRTDIVINNGIYLNTGEGSFTVASIENPAITGYPQLNISADLNDDGFPEIIYTNFDEVCGVVSFNGSTFSNVLLSPTLEWGGQTPLVLDINNDGIKDIIHKLTGSSTLRFTAHFGLGNLEFAPLVLVSQSDLGGERGFFVDLNNDQFPDYLHSYQNKCYVHYNNGGYFNSPVQLNDVLLFNNSQPGCMDMNNDGAMDIYFINENGKDCISLNTEGIFSDPQVVPVTSGSFVGFEVTDWNADGESDIILATKSQILFLENLGNLDFVYPASLLNRTNITELKTIDFDQDSDSDVFVVCTDSIFLYENNGETLGDFEVIPIQYFSGSSFISKWVSIDFGDFDSDGWQDLIVVATYGIGAVWGSHQFIREIAIYPNLQGQIVSDAIYHEEAGPFSNLTHRNPKLRDINGDGFLDLYVRTSSDYNIFWLNNGNSGLIPQNFGFSDLANIDEDLELEFVGKNSLNGQLTVGQSNDDLQTVFETLNSGPIYTAQFVFVDSDDLIDIVAWSSSCIIPIYWRNMGNGSFQNNGAIDFPGSSMQKLVHQSDIDGDLDRDILNLSYSGLSLAENSAQPIGSIIVQVFVDQNGNGIFDNEPLLSGIQIGLNAGLWQATNSNGEALFAKPPGEYEIHCSLNSELWLLASNPSQIATVPPVGGTVSVQFALVPNGVVPNTQIYFHPNDSLCLNQVNSSIVISNNGNVNGPIELTMNLDSLTSFISSQPAPFSVFGQSVSWHLDNLGINASQEINLTLSYPGADYIGQEITHYFQMEQFLQDGAPIDTQTTVIEEIITCSYDPNDIVELNGWTDQGYVLVDDELIYRIRFENTGNMAAETVFVRDYLPHELDCNSVRLIASSHPVQVSWNQSGRLDFLFNDINLPPSMSDQIQSHGFIYFGIKPKSTLAALDQFNNRAKIYFDYNPPIVTNTHLNTIFECGLMGDYSPDHIEICEGQFVSFESPFMFTEHYNWSMDDVTLGHSAILNIQSLPEGNHTLWHQAENPLCVANYSQTIDALSLPSITNILQVSDTLYVISNGDVYWFFEGQPLTNGPSELVEINQNGYYSAIAFLDNCQSQTVSNYFIVDGISNSESAFVLVYPNPSSGLANISVSNDMIGKELRLYDSVGKLVSAYTISSMGFQLDFTNVLPGLYLVEIAEQKIKIQIE